jgi:type VI secretion system protein VasG
MNVNLKGLIGRLDTATRGALEGAAGLCLSRTHYDIEVDHLLLKFVESTSNDVARIFHQFGIDTSRLQKELESSIDKLKRGNARNPVFSPSLIALLTEAWTLASLDFNAAHVRSGHVILALISNQDLSRRMREVSAEIQKIQQETLKKNLRDITQDSEEDLPGPTKSVSAGPSSAPLSGGRTPNLDQFTVNLVANAKNGKIDPVLGRDFEIRQVIDILMRRRQNNPILTGEAGVGKTAVVEGFALRISQGDVPAPLKNVEVRTLDLALLQAGAGVKGEFENRLKGLIEEVKSSPKPIILFIDEAHTMIGAGGQAGQNDAANLLKPALARGEIRTIAATTWSEYKKYFEKDPALARRFQVIKVEEPDEPTCMVMLRGIVEPLEKHHSVRVLDEGVAAAVRLSHRYLTGRQLPDKAVSVLDTACARLALNQNSVPAAIEDVIREIDDLAVQARVLEREAAVGADHSERLGKIAGQKHAAEERLKALQARFDKERDLVMKIRDVRARLEGKASEDETAGLRSDLEISNNALAELQGDQPLIRVCVDSQTVSEVISGWTGIPVRRMMKDEVQTVLSLEAHLQSRIIAQDHALGQIANRIRMSRASLDDPNKPVGVFLLVGPSGVGKTETALTLADLMYGGERNLITINMSEFQEAHTVSTLKGSPPGYVGYGEGGVLTEAVRRKPYSVVLLDEVEKAHPDVLELFFQVFDKGKMEDGEGREIDFKNTIIILTSNAGTNTLMKLTEDPLSLPVAEDVAVALKPELDRIFKPAFLGRLAVIPYFPLRDDAMRKIITLKLDKIQQRLRQNHDVRLCHDDSFVEEVARRCTEVESGARNVDKILTNTLLPEISRRLLGAMAEGEKMGSIDVSVGEDSEFVYS